MFHLFNSVYLDIDLALGSHEFDAFYISEKLIPKVDPNVRFRIISEHSSVEAFLAKYSKSSTDSFWQILYNHVPGSSRLVVYTSPEILVRLQIEYWKSILPNSSLNSVFMAHQIYIEDCRFRSFLPTNVESLNSKNAYQRLNNLSKSNFSDLYKRTNSDGFLTRIPKSCLSFEYQLADFFWDSNSELKSTVLNKVKHFTWTNWIAELEILKGDILNGILDVNRLLPTSDQLQLEDPAQIFPQVLGNPYISWVADHSFAANNYSYVEKNYNKEIFKFLYERFYSLWQVNGEDMSELIDLIYDHRYEELLRRDVKRSFGCVYSGGRQRDRMNQTLISAIYSFERSKSLDKLAEFALHRI